MRDWFLRALKIEPGISLAQWAYDRVARNWQWLVSGGGGAGMAYLSAGAAVVNQYGPFGWAAVGLLSSFVILLMLLMYQRLTRWRIWNAHYRRVAASPDAVNPLDTQFDRKRVRLSDFAPPAGKQIVGKTFMGCQIVGPANVFLDGQTTIRRMASVNVDAVLLGNHRGAWNVYAIENCTFIDCTFFDITFFVTREDFHNFVKSMINVNWSTDIPRDLAAPFLTPDELLQWDAKFGIEGQAKPGSGAGEGSGKP